MTPIRIIATKIGYNNNFIKYVNSLTRTASYAHGFIGSNSYWQIGTNKTIISVSDWTTHDNWEKWLNSKERAEVHEVHKLDVKSEKFYALIKRKDTNNTFLL
jgi:heme-degrading monooxygenase HmoA